MGVSNAIKQSTCEKYRTYLEIIYTYGNKVMLMKQLYQYAEVLGLAKNSSTFYSSIIELVKNEILRKEPFVAYGKKTQLQMLTMRKYGIRFMEGKHDSYSVASVPKSNGNERVLVSIYKSCYIHNKVIPRIQREGNQITLSAITDILERDYSTIMLNKNQGITLMTKIRNDKTLQNFLDFSEVEHDIRRIQEIQKKQEEGLRKGSISFEGKGKGKLHSSSFSPVADLKNKINTSDKRDLTKEEKIENYTIDNMLSFNAYIAQIKVNNNRLSITVLIFDIYNKRNIYKIVTHIACIYKMFYRYLKCKFSLTVGVISIDENASKNMIKQSEVPVRDFISKEVKGTRLSVILNDWRVDDLMQERIKIRFSDYNITNDFMDGIKHANLVKR